MFIMQYYARQASGSHFTECVYTAQNTYESGTRLYAGSLMNNVLTNDNTTINNNGEICMRKLAAFYNKQSISQNVH